MIEYKNFILDLENCVESVFKEVNYDNRKDFCMSSLYTLVKTFLIENLYKLFLI